MTKILVMNGPNLNALGRRDIGFYGAVTLDHVNNKVSQLADELGVEVAFFQSNVEGHLVDCIQEHFGTIQGIIINPGALTHYSYTLKDGLIDSGVPIIEVHLSNPYARDEWRRHSVVTDIARGQIAGFGWRGYTVALDILAAIIKEEAA